MQQRISVWQQQRQMQHSQLNRSIRKTYSEIKRDHPNQVEQDEINRAVELSMLDFALVPQKSQGNNKVAFQNARPPHVILGIAEDAIRTEIKTAYRKLAKLHHPDKTGGDSTRFDEILRAYKAMMALSVSSHETSGGSDTFMVHDKDASADVAARLKSTAHWDQELQDHRRLVNDLFQADGMDLQACVDKQLNALELLGLAFKDAGATNRNEKDEIITNSCFYLSLAVSRLWGIGVLNFDNGAEKRDGVDDDLDTIMAESETELNEMLIGDTALDFKRGIEASVVKAHPEWAAQGKVGEEVQAFSDFLVYVLDSLMAECAVVVFDTTSGFCDIYKGKCYDKLAASIPENAQANTLTVRYIPGHYQPLIPSRKDARRPMLQDIVSALDNYGILYAITGGN